MMHHASLHAYAMHFSILARVLHVLILDLAVREKTAMKVMKNGFTLMELLITLVVIAILAKLSIPALRSQLIQSRLKAAAETFAQTAQVARSEAVMRQQSVFINLVTGSSWCYGVNLASSCSCSPLNNCTLAYVAGSLYPSVSVAATGFPSGNISYDSERGLVSTASSVTFSVGSQLITVMLNRLGGFTFCSTGVSGYSAC